VGNENGLIGIDGLRLKGKAKVWSHLHSSVSGAIRPACHVLPPQCESQPCMNGGTCTEGWNRFLCDCSSTSFNGPTCGKGNLTENIKSNVTHESNAFTSFDCYLVYSGTISRGV
jgi:hypothetical protein